MKKAIVFSGSGGQGVMSAGILLAQGAVADGKRATYLPEYGPQQRGGSAKCTVVINEGEIVSPLVHECDFLVALNEISFEKFLPQLKSGGVVIVNSSIVKDYGARDDVRVIPVAAEDLAMEIGNPRAANFFMLGALTGASGLISQDSFCESLKRKFASKAPAVVESNLKAFLMGVGIGSK